MPSSADEAEVAELLAELPTHRPPPLYRRWAEVPLPARVHVHGLPGGGDGALFRGAPAFSAALWRCTGYVPKRFGFRYCEFPSWADDNDGADALFALAREKPREMTDDVLIGTEPKKEKHYVRSLSCRGKKIDSDQQAMTPLTKAKKREPDSWKNECQQSEGCGIQDSICDDGHAETNMISSDLLTAKTKKKMEESLEPSGENNNCEQVEISSKDGKKVPMKLEVSSGVQTTSSIVEQEVHSGFVGVEVTMYKQQPEEDHIVCSRPDITSSGPIKVQDIQGLPKQPNQASNLQVVAGVPDLLIGQPKPQTIKTEPSSQENKAAHCVDLVSDDHESNKQGLGDAAVLSIVQKDSSNLKYGSVSHEHLKSEAQNPRHTVAENPNSTLGSAKVCTSFSGSVSTPPELSHSLASKEPSSGNSDCSKKEELLSPTVSKHDPVKFSEDSSQEVTRYSEKVQLKDSQPSAPKSSQASRIHLSTVKHRLPVSKEQSQKIALTGGTSARSFHGEVPSLQSRNKAAACSSSQKKDKIYQRIINVTQDSSNNSAPTELRASDSAAPLSDEQLALLLHQQLNSSPRVPRVPRCHQAAGAQMLHSTGSSVFSKRYSSHGGRDHAAVIKKRNREDSLKDSEDTKRTEKRHRVSSTEHAPVKNSCRSAENIASEQKIRGICPTGANAGLAKDDLMDTIVSHNLPGLIDEIVSKDRNITYVELCDAIHQHFRDSRKSNGGDSLYRSYADAIKGCLRKRREWAHLFDQASKMNSNKRRTGESNSLLPDVPDAENIRTGPDRDSEGSADLHQDNLPRGKRKCRKRRRLELKGRRVRDTRKRSSIDSSSEDAAAPLSDSSSDRNSNPRDDESKEDNSVAQEIGGYIDAKGAASST